MNKQALKLFATVSLIVSAFGLLSVFIAFKKKDADQARKEAVEMQRMAEEAKMQAEKAQKVTLEQLQECQALNAALQAKLNEQ